MTVLYLLRFDAFKKTFRAPKKRLIIRRISTNDSNSSTSATGNDTTHVADNLAATYSA